MKLKYVLLLLLIFFVSCTKDPDDSSIKENSCKIKNLYVSGSNTVSLTFEYDSQGRVIKTSGIPDDRYEENIYAYSGNTLSISYSRYPKAKVIYQLNSDGLAKTRNVFDRDGNLYFTIDYFYSGLELIKTVTTVFDSMIGNRITTEKYEWTNGNMVSRLYEDGRRDNFSYYTDKLNRPGDYFFDWFYGCNGTNDYGFILDPLSVRNKNLCKGLSGGTFPATYTFDEKGNITHVYDTGLPVSSFAFDYECK